MIKLLNRNYRSVTLATSLLIIGWFIVYPALISAQSIYKDLQDRLQISWQSYDNSSASFLGKFTAIDDDLVNASYIASVYAQPSCNGEASYVLRGLTTVGKATDIILPVNQKLDVNNLCLEVCTVFYNDQEAYPICNQQLTKDLQKTEQITETELLALNLPQIGSIFSGEFNKINWNIKKALNSNQRIEVAYKLVGGNRDFQQLALLPVTTTNYFLDVSSLANGRYQIRVSVLNADLRTVQSSVTSPAFLIDNPAISQSVSKGVITELTPSAGSTTQNQRPNISGKFILPSNESIDTATFKLIVNGFDRSEYCRVDNQGFQCQQAPSLNGGLQFVQIAVRTSTQAQLGANWQFNVDASTASNNGGSFLGLNLNGVNWMFVLVLISVVGLIVFLIWYIVLRLRNRVTEGYYSEYEENNSYVVEDRSPVITETKVVNQDNSTTVTDNSNKNVYLDPTDFATYEDYLKAVSSKLAESEKTYVSVSVPSGSTETTTTTEIKAADVITVPDYSIDTNSASSASSGDNKSSSNDSSTPDWLKA